MTKLRLPKLSEGLQQVTVPSGGSWGNVLGSTQAGLGMGMQITQMTGGADMGLGTALGALGGLAMGLVQKQKMDDQKKLAEAQNKLVNAQNRENGGVEVMQQKRLFTPLASQGMKVKGKQQRRPDPRVSQTLRAAYSPDAQQPQDRKAEIMSKLKAIHDSLPDETQRQGVIALAQKLQSGEITEDQAEEIINSAMGNQQARKGVDPYKSMFVEAEGGELVVDSSSGDIKDFIKGPSHEEGGVKLLVQNGEAIVPKNKAQEYMTEDKKSRRKIISTLPEEPIVFAKKGLVLPDEDDDDEEDQGPEGKKQQSAQKGPVTVPYRGKIAWKELKTSAIAQVLDSYGFNRPIATYRNKDGYLRVFQEYPDNPKTSNSLDFKVPSNVNELKEYVRGLEYRSPSIGIIKSHMQQVYGETISDDEAKQIKRNYDRANEMYKENLSKTMKALDADVRSEEYRRNPEYAKIRQNFEKAYNQMNSAFAATTASNFDPKSPQSRSKMQWRGSDGKVLNLNSYYGKGILAPEDPLYNKDKPSSSNIFDLNTGQNISRTTTENSNQQSKPVQNITQNNPVQDGSRNKQEQRIETKTQSPEYMSPRRNEQQIIQNKQQNTVPETKDHLDFLGRYKPIPYQQNIQNNTQNNIQKSVQNNQGIYGNPPKFPNSFKPVTNTTSTPNTARNNVQPEPEEDFTGYVSPPRRIPQVVQEEEDNGGLSSQYKAIKKRMEAMRNAEPETDDENPPNNPVKPPQKVQPEPEEDFTGYVAPPKRIPQVKQEEEDDGSMISQYKALRKRIETMRNAEPETDDENPPITSTNNPQKVRPEPEPEEDFTGYVAPPKRVPQVKQDEDDGSMLSQYKALRKRIEAVRNAEPETDDENPPQSVQPQKQNDDNFFLSAYNALKQQKQQLQQRQQQSGDDASLLSTYNRFRRGIDQANQPQINGINPLVQPQINRISPQVQQQQIGGIYPQVQQQQISRVNPQVQQQISRINPPVQPPPQRPLLPVNPYNLNLEYNPNPQQQEFLPPLTVTDPRYLNSTANYPAPSILAQNQVINPVVYPQNPRLPQSGITVPWTMFGDNDDRAKILQNARNRYNAIQDAIQQGRDNERMMYDRTAVSSFENGIIPEPYSQRDVNMHDLYMGNLMDRAQQLPLAPIEDRTPLQSSNAFNPEMKAAPEVNYNPVKVEPRDPNRNYYQEAHNQALQMGISPSENPEAYDNYVTYYLRSNGIEPQKGPDGRPLYVNQLTGVTYSPKKLNPGVAEPEEQRIQNIPPKEIEGDPNELRDFLYGNNSPNTNLNQQSSAVNPSMGNIGLNPNNPNIGNIGLNQNPANSPLNQNLANNQLNPQNQPINGNQNALTPTNLNPQKLLPGILGNNNPLNPYTSNGTGMNNNGTGISNNGMTDDALKGKTNSKFNDSSNINTNTNVSSDVNLKEKPNTLARIGELLPTMYNLGRFMFDKPEVVQTPPIRLERLNYQDLSDPTRLRIEQANYANQDAARNLSGGNAGNVRANMMMSNVNAAQDLGAVNQQEMGRYDQIRKQNVDIGNQETQMNYQQMLNDRLMNMQNKANYEKFLTKGLTGLAQKSSQTIGDDYTKRRDALQLAENRRYNQALLNEQIRSNNIRERMDVLRFMAQMSDNPYALAFLKNAGFNFKTGLTQNGSAGTVDIMNNYIQQSKPPAFSLTPSTKNLTETGRYGGVTGTYSGPYLGNERTYSSDNQPQLDPGNKQLQMTPTNGSATPYPVIPGALLPVNYPDRVVQFKNKAELLPANQRSMNPTLSGVQLLQNPQDLQNTQNPPLQNTVKKQNPLLEIDPLTGLPKERRGAKFVLKKPVFNKKR